MNNFGKAKGNSINTNTTIQTNSISTISYTDASLSDAIGTLLLDDTMITKSNELTLDLDSLTSINLIYKNNSYTIDKETLISLLFNYEDIIRNIVKEELDIYE